jgi:hypothetical protein
VKVDEVIIDARTDPSSVIMNTRTKMTSWRPGHRIETGWALEIPVGLEPLSATPGSGEGGGRRMAKDGGGYLGGTD